MERTWTCCARNRQTETARNRRLFRQSRLICVLAIIPSLPPPMKGDTIGSNQRQRRALETQVTMALAHVHPLHHLHAGWTAHGTGVVCAGAAGAVGASWSFHSAGLLKEWSILGRLGASQSIKNRGPHRKPRTAILHDGGREEQPGSALRNVIHFSTFLALWRFRFLFLSFFQLHVSPSVINIATGVPPYLLCWVHGAFALSFSSPYFSRQSSIFTRLRGFSSACRRN